jgi:hypothetical protein
MIYEVVKFMCLIGIKKKPFRAFEFISKNFLCEVDERLVVK